MKSATIARTFFASHIFANNPPHELRPSRAIGRDCSLLERLGERARIAVLPAMIERTKAGAHRREYQDPLPSLAKKGKWSPYERSIPIIWGYRT